MGVIVSIVHSDEAEFMPNKSTEVTLRRLLLNMQSLADIVGHRALHSLDAMKAFDSIEWIYLWEVLKRFGFGERYISWVCLLYCHPQSAIRASHIFTLGRGTRQGCPLSPLFALAIEPLAIKIRDNLNIIGFCYGNR